MLKKKTSNMFTHIHGLCLSLSLSLSPLLNYGGGGRAGRRTSKQLRSWRRTERGVGGPEGTGVHYTHTHFTHSHSHTHSPKISEEHANRGLCEQWLGGSFKQTRKQAALMPTQTSIMQYASLSYWRPQSTHTNTCTHTHMHAAYILTYPHRIYIFMQHTY